MSKVKKIILILIFCMGVFVFSYKAGYLDNVSFLRATGEQQAGDEVRNESTDFKHKSLIADPTSKLIKTDLKDIEPVIKKELNVLLNTSSDGLVEVIIDDGYMVDLNKRFRTVPVATINDNGEIVVQDYVAPPPD